MTSGGREVDAGGEGPNCQTGSPVQALLRFRTPDLSVMETIRLDQYETQFQV